jgi:hypothetical protein
MVTLMEGDTPLGSAELNAGAANVVVNGLAVGSHRVTAVYAGDGSFNVNATSSTTVRVLAPPSL